MNEKVYLTEDAASFILKIISDELVKKFSFGDIYVILETEFEWMQQNGLVSETRSLDIEYPPITIDSESLEYYVIYQCVKKDIILSYEELSQIFEAEIEYLRSLDLIDDTDEIIATWHN